MYDHSEPARAGSKIFLATPISALPPQEYDSFRLDVLALCADIEAHPAVSEVYCAARNIRGAQDFSGSGDALATDLANLLDSDAFVLLYPRRLHSSVIVEAGVALGRQIPMLLLVNEAEDLPYLLRAASDLALPGAPPMTVASMRGSSPARLFQAWLDGIARKDLLIAAE